MCVGLDGEYLSEGLKSNSRGRQACVDLAWRACTSLLPPVEVSLSLTDSPSGRRQLRSCSSCCTCSRTGFSSSPRHQPWRQLWERDFESFGLPKRKTGMKWCHSEVQCRAGSLRQPCLEVDPNSEKAGPQQPFVAHSCTRDFFLCLT